MRRSVNVWCGVDGEDESFAPDRRSTEIICPTHPRKGRRPVAPPPLPFVAFETTFVNEEEEVDDEEDEEEDEERRSISISPVLVRRCESAGLNSLEPR